MTMVTCTCVVTPTLIYCMTSLLYRSNNKHIYIAEGQSELTNCNNLKTAVPESVHNFQVLTMGSMFSLDFHLEVQSTEL